MSEIAVANRFSPQPLTRDPSLLTKRGLGAEVLRRLRLLCPLPTTGFAAGQSVASVIDQILETGPCVLNDVDVFMLPVDYAEASGGFQRDPKTGEFTHGLKGSIHKTRSVNPHLTMPILYRPGDDSDYSSAMPGPGVERGAYTVTAVHREGLLNLVAVEFTSWHQFSRSAGRRALQRMHVLVSAFDLNSTQVALDLQSGRLHFTAAFEQFFATRELRVLATLTPFQSLARYLKKRKELQCFGNDEGHLRYAIECLRLAQYPDAMEAVRADAFQQGSRTMPFINQYRQRARVFNLGEGVNGTAMAVGKKFHQLFETHRDQLTPYLTMVKHGKYDVWLPTPTAEALRDCALPHHGLHPKLATSQGRRFWELHLPASKTVRLRRERFDEYRESLPEQDANFLRTYLQMGGDSWLEGMENDGPMKELLPMLQEHSEVRYALSHLPFGRQAQVLKVAKARMKRADLRDAWGVFRNMKPHDIEAWMRNPALLDERLERIRTEDGPLVTAKLPLPAVIAVGKDETLIHVTELICNPQLRAEGSHMAHCVAGYGSAIADHSCRIVSLRYSAQALPEYCATAEWRWSEALATRDNASMLMRPLTVGCQQLRSYRNASPLDPLVQAEEQLRDEMNAWLRANVEAGWQLLDPARYEIIKHRRTSAQKQTPQPA